ncbi:MAG: hypothetical protein Q9M19_04110, partial [Mariprofundaceae bacterium]|nr:hypothetical protein [Mariprofundaceae bacterium]
DSDSANGALLESFCQAMNDDFNTAEAVAALFDGCRDLNKALDDDADHQATQQQAASFIAMANMLGLLQQDAETWFQGDAVDTVAIEALIEARVKAKQERDFTQADAIRDELLGQGIVLEDSATGTRWKKA